MRHHHLAASVETCHWGYFEGGLPPALTVAPGDRVTFETVSGGPDVLPPPGFTVPPELLDIHARAARPLPGHILTGPVAVEGAQPGDVLEVRILEVEPRLDWGYTAIRPLAGTLPDDFPDTHIFHSAIDIAARRARLPWGQELELRPFFGVMGTAPPPQWGKITSLVPRAMGGNLDLKELVAGTTLFLPVFVPGANFSCGDGHGAQGDGEVCVTAIETGLTGTFEFHVHRGAPLARPRAETPTHVVTLATDPDLDRCAEIALRDMIGVIAERTGLTRPEAYALASLAADLRITQTVNGHKGVHCMMEKTHLARVR
jgi:acetamidase/formamidase